MINRMIVANLRRRPVRSLVSVVAVGIEVVLILMVVGLVNGMINDHRARVEGIGADIIVRGGGASMLTELSGNTLPLKMAPVFQQVPGVVAVAPVAYQLGQAAQAIGGVNLAEFNAVSGGFRFLKGGPFHAGSYEMIADDLQAASAHYRIGQKIPLLGQQFTLTGIFEHGMGSRVFIPLDVLDRLGGTPDRAATFYIKTQPNVPIQDVVERLRKLAPSLKVDSLNQFLSLFTASRISPAVPIFQRVMVGIAVAIGFLVIFLSLYTTVLERTREIGILKSLGASRSYIVSVILRESELLAALGVGAGTAASYLLWRLLQQVYPTLTLEWTWQWVGWAAVIALGSSAVGALYPAYKAASQDPIAALAYE
ncbi:MAG TPA: FtsX-like permease family protein [Terriglobales bacterium]|jgi:putative ABC transport system permease protein